MSLAQFILTKATRSATEAEILERRKRDGRTGKPKKAAVKRGRPTRWTIDRDFLLEELAKEFSGADVARRMGVTYDAVKSRAHRIGVKLRNERPGYHHWKPEEFETLKKLYMEGDTSIVIGQKMGLTDTQIRGALNRLKLTGKRKFWTLDMEFTVAKWFNHKDNETLCNALGLRVGALRSRYIKLSRDKRLESLRDSKGHKDLLAEYCHENGIALPVRNKR